MSISLQCDQNFCAPGDNLTGTVNWNCSKVPDRIIIELVWNTAGRGTTDSGSGCQESFPCSSPTGENTFSLKIPKDCVPSYKGSLVSIQWSIKARADISWASDPKTSVGIIISSTGKPLEPIDDFQSNEENA